MKTYRTGFSLLAGFVCSICILTATPARALPGDLDPGLGGFGVGGRIQDAGFDVFAVTLDLQGRLLLAGRRDGTFHLQRRSGPRFLTVEDAGTIILGIQTSAVANAVAVAPDGKIVLAGYVGYDFDYDIAVARFNDDLSPDETFAGDSTANVDFDDDFDGANAVAIQDDLKIVVVGSADITSVIVGDADWAAVRFNENGTLDSSFNDDGKWSFDADHENDRAHAVAIQDDGKILIAGSIGPDQFFDNQDFAVVRLNANGSYDNSFGGDGRVDVAFGGEEGALGVAIDPVNGSVVLAGGGFSGYAPVSEDIKVARLLSNGGVDNSFDGDGKLILPIDGGTATAFAVHVQPDHKTVIAGRAVFDGGSKQLFLARFNPDGSLDPTFGDAGIAFTQYGSPSPFDGEAALVAQANGSFVAVADDYPDRGLTARFRSDGTLDAGGVVDIVFDPAHTGSEATALAVDGDGKLIASGKAFIGDYDMALARYEPSYANGLDLTFGTGFPQTGRSLYGIGGSLETRAVAVRDDGKIVVGGRSFFNDYNFLIGRFKADGTPDEACSAIGLATVNYGIGDDSVAAVLVLGDRTYAAGTVRGPTNADFGLVRLNNGCLIDDAGGAVPQEYKFRFDLGGEDILGGMVQQVGVGFVLAGTSAGNVVLVRTRQSIFTGNVTLDPNFGTAGQAILDVGEGEVVTGFGKQSNGKLVVSGTVNLGGGSNFFVARFDANGAVDGDFGLGGVAFASFNSVDVAHALAIRADDTIAVVGCTTTANGEVFAVAQFTADGEADAAFNGNGKATVRTGPSGEECAQAATFEDTDRLVVGGYTSIFGVRNFVLAAFQTDVLVTTTTLGPTTTTTTFGSTTTTTLSNRTCGDINGDDLVTASDALGVLRAAVGTDVCELCSCDVDGSGAVAASDALRVLRRAVGEAVPMDCPPCVNVSGR